MTDLEHECEFFLVEGHAVWACECGKIQVFNKEFFPEEELQSLRSELEAVKYVANKYEESNNELSTELSKKNEEIKQLREALNEYIEAFMFSNNTYVDWIPTKELIAVYDKAKSLTKPTE